MMSESEPVSTPETRLEARAVRPSRVKRRRDWKSDLRSVFLGLVGATLVAVVMLAVFSSAVGVRVEGRSVVAIAILSGILAGIYVQERQRGLWFVFSTVLGAAAMCFAVFAGGMIHMMLG